MQLKMFGATDQGLVRTSNQDAYFFNAEYGIVIVSDGMGGHKGGEIASKMTVDGLKNAYFASNQILLEHVGSFLDDILCNINANILKQSNNNINLRGMGATVNYLQFAGGVVAIGHAGDSRTYLLRAYKSTKKKTLIQMCQITIDHNVGTFIERGLLKINKSQKNISERQRSRLTRGMGITSDLKADLYYRNLKDGDVLLTCSDGLHGYVSEAHITETVANGPIADAPKRLIELVKQAGAPDNITVVISIWSKHDEPFLNSEIENPNQDLLFVRMPNGHILGPTDLERVIKCWLKGDIPSDAEVSSGFKKWVFLQNSNELFLKYPTFERPSVRAHFAMLKPSSMLTLKSKFAYTKQDAFKLAQPLVIVVALFFLLIFMMFIWPTIIQYSKLIETVSP